MNASCWMVSVFLCAMIEPPQGFAPLPPPQEPPAVVVEGPVKSAESRIVGVTVYPGQALVSREVRVPEGEGTIEVVVTPLPAQVIASSLDAEGDETSRVLSTRFRSRLVLDKSLDEWKTQQEQLATLKAEVLEIQAKIAAQGQDLQFLQKLEGFTTAKLVGSTERGKVETDPVIEISKFLMESRGEKTRLETDLKLSLQTANEAVETVQGRIAELQGRTKTVERDAVILVQKQDAKAGTLRLTYLVNNARWWPQYRLRATDEKSPVSLEYLAAVTQQTGEDWPDVRVTLSTTKPSLDAAPPELLPLKIAEDASTTEAISEDTSQSAQVIRRELDRMIDLPFATETPLSDVVKFVRESTRNATFPQGIPIYIDPIGLTEAEKTTESPVVFNVDHLPLKTSLKLLLKQLDLDYVVKDGLLTITSSSSLDNDFDPQARNGMGGGFGGMGGGMGGMGGSGFSMERVQANEGSMLNRTAAVDQSQELRVGDSAGSETMSTEKEIPGMTVTAPNPLTLPSRSDPQLIEIGKSQLAASFYAKAVPILTSRVYRLAKLTNAGPMAILPGEATVYMGDDFVGRMTMPLVATGEPFLAGFGVDTQIQISRRLLAKTRLVQGGNQVLSYEFRLGVRNYRDTAVTLELWDRLPLPEGETVAVNLVKTSTDLSKDPLYEKTARIDNLLRWDLDVPAGTVGDKTVYVNYEFRLEYPRDMPLPRFTSGGLNEAPIGGGAMGGMGGGFR